jgi:transcriptional regulator with XRE-family HTH domain
MAETADAEIHEPVLSARDLLALGKKLAELRRKSGRSQRQLGREAGISSSRLSRIERGRCKTSLEELARLRAVFGFDLDEIVFGRTAISSSSLERLARILGEVGDPVEVGVVERLMQCLIQDKTLMDRTARA